MTIFQVLMRYWPAMGGVEDYVHQLSRRLAKEHKLSVWTTLLENHHDGSCLKEPLETVHEGVDIRRYPLSPGRIKHYRWSWALRQGLSQALKDGEGVVHGHGFMSYASDVAAGLAKAHQRPFVFNPYLADMGAPSALGRIYRKTFGQRLMRSDAVVVISEYERKLLERWGYCSLKRVDMIPPGVDLAEFQGPLRDVLHRKGIVSSRVVLCAGRIDYMKGGDVLLRAAKALAGDARYRDVAYVWVGPDFGYEATLRQMAKDWGLEDQVFFLGAVSREELTSLYREATLLAFPTRYEAFGIVAAEAMAAGTPVVGANGSALPYVLVDEHTGFLFQQDDAVDLARKMRWILDDESLRHGMGLAGIAHVRDHFCWDVSAAKLQELYRQLNGSC